MAEKRHAYCIIAHNDIYCLSTLISMIDDTRNDIYVVLDKKSALRKEDLPRLKYSRLYVPERSQLIDIQWGGVSMIHAELLAFNMAIENGDYAYIHLLSGQDLPLKDQDFIHDYFESLPGGTNCINIEPYGNSKDILSYNCSMYYLFIEKTRLKNKVRRKFYSFIRNSAIRIQKLLRVQRKWDDLILGKGHQWVSITGDFARYLVENKSYILSRFKYVNCPDEIYKQTICLSSPYKNTIICQPYVDPSLRHIDWNRGSPYVWTKEDINELMECRELFARKFSSSVDKEVIDLISKRLH